MAILGAKLLFVGSVAVEKIYAGSVSAYARITRSWWAQEQGDFVYSWND